MTIIEASEKAQEMRKQIYEMLTKFIQETKHIPMLESYTHRPVIGDGLFNVDIGIEMGVIGLEEAEFKVKGKLWSHKLLKTDKK